MTRICQIALAAVFLSGAASMVAEAQGCPSLPTGQRCINRFPNTPDQPIAGGFTYTCASVQPGKTQTDYYIGGGYLCSVIY
ncbi:MAG: hypothetical protein AAGI34_05485 [Pseudomonadota bacterium]